MRRTCSRSATRISPIGSPPTWTKFERCTPGSRREPAADPRLGHSQDQDLAVLLGFSLLLRRSLQLDTARPEQINGKYERGREEEDDEQRVPRRADLRLVQHRRREELGDGDGRDGEQELEERRVGDVRRAAVALDGLRLLLHGPSGTHTPDRHTRTCPDGGRRQRPAKASALRTMTRAT